MIFVESELKFSPECLVGVVDFDQFSPHMLSGVAGVSLEGNNTIKHS